MMMMTTKDVHVAQLQIVFDGGLLLHKVIWQRGAKISTICKSYIHFITKNVWTCVQDAEQQRKSADIYFSEDTEINVKQEEFL